MAAKKKSVKKSPKKAPAKAKKTTGKASGKPSARKAAPKPGKKAAGAKKSTRVVRKSKRPAPKRKAPARAGKAAPKAAKSALPAAPEALALARSIATVASEKKAENIVIIDTRARASSVGYDYVVLATGESDRQLAAIHEGVDELLKPQGKRASSVEASPDWVCVNYDVGVLAHFFTPDKREVMDLEGMWKDAPRVSL
jgi:ribosome silencing factor RsfS/YbeB/iojap